MRFELIWRDGEPTLNPKKTEAAESLQRNAAIRRIKQILIQFDSYHYIHVFVQETNRFNRPTELHFGISISSHFHMIFD